MGFYLFVLQLITFSVLAIAQEEPKGDPNDAQNKSSDNKNNSNSNLLLLILNVVLLLAIILLLILYYNTSKKLNRIVKGHIYTSHEQEKDVETSINVKRVEIGEGTTMMTVEERKELMFFNDETKFQMGELLRASAEALGHGIMGNSYKAMLNNGHNIVVKRLRDLKPFTKEEFAKIVKIIADLKHPNLLPLLAYYHSRDEKLMLYRYAQNGNLFSKLHGNFHQLGLFFSYSNLYLSFLLGIVSFIVPHMVYDGSMFENFRSIKL
jgi:hypothetical protein